MYTYLFQGLVLPERSPITLRCSSTFTHVVSGVNAVCHLSIVLNQIAVWIETETVWDIYDLRNVVKGIVQSELAIVGYVKGYAYYVGIDRVQSRELDVDVVFGIDIPCVSDRSRDADVADRVAGIRSVCTGPEGIYIRRCLADLSSAMKEPDDTAFYCYRAIECLRKHCAERHGIASRSEKIQWETLREVAGCSKDTIMAIKQQADTVRHGGVSQVTSSDREWLFGATWDIVDGYLRVR